MFVADEIVRIFKESSQPDIDIDNNTWAKWKSDLTLQNRIVMQALLHDAAEVYISDVPSPLKRIATLRPIIKELEYNLMKAIYISLNIKDPTVLEERLIKHADLIAQKIEAFTFMHSRGKHWEGLPEVSLERLQQFTAPVESLASYKMFMTRYNQLRDL